MDISLFCFLYSNSEYIILVHIIMIGDLFCFLYFNSKYIVLVQIIMIGDLKYGYILSWFILL
jgi:hypothetical protein